MRGRATFQSAIAGGQFGQNTVLASLKLDSVRKRLKHTVVSNQVISIPVPSGALMITGQDETFVRYANVIFFYSIQRQTVGLEKTKTGPVKVGWGEGSGEKQVEERQKELLICRL